jgi:hypothetical protein
MTTTIPDQLVAVSNLDHRGVTIVELRDGAVWLVGEDGGR